MASRRQFCIQQAVAQTLEFRGRQARRTQESLEGFALQPVQVVALCGGFTLGDNGQFQGPRHGNGGADNGAIAFIGR